MDYKRLFYPETEFGGFTDVDGTVAFYERVNALVGPDAVLLDVGCGRGSFVSDPVPFRKGLRTFKGRCQRVIGIDVDDEGRANPFLDEFHLIAPGQPWPLADASVDVCLCDYVVEHLEDPAAFFAQAARVLKPGGYLCIRTPNLLSYFGMLSTLIPARLHNRLIHKVQDRKREETDIFPVRYRCNTLGALRRRLREAGFVSFVHGYDPEPDYLSFSRILYSLGVLYQRFAPGLFKVVIFAYARKTARA